MDIDSAPVGADELAQQERPPIAEPRDEVAELMTGVGLSDRSGAAGNQGAQQKPEPRGTSQPGGVEAEFGGQRLVEHEQLRLLWLLGLPADRHLRQLTGEAVLQRDGDIRLNAHAIRLRIGGS